MMTHYRYAAALALGLLVGWIANGWRMDAQLAEQGRALEAEIAARDQLHAATLAEISNAAATQVRAEHDRRLALESALAELSQAKHKELTDAQANAARLRTRLAAADLRLSVALDPADADQCDGVPPPATPGGVVHAPPRARLDPAHAQRIIGITDEGDEGLIALAACQAYVRKITAPR